MLQHVAMPFYTIYYAFPLCNLISSAHRASLLLHSVVIHPASSFNPGEQHLSNQSILIFQQFPTTLLWRSLSWCIILSMLLRQHWLIINFQHYKIIIESDETVYEVEASSWACLGLIHLGMPHFSLLYNDTAFVFSDF